MQDVTPDQAEDAYRRAAELARLEAQQREVQAEIEHFSAGDRLSRDEVHDRAPR